MIRPDDEEKPFVARWNTLARILLVESSVKLVARTAADYADFRDGTTCFPGNQRLARDTGLSERTVRTAWGVLRGLKMAERVAGASAHERLSDEYQLVIPDNWKHKPILGPAGKKFTCLNCGKPFNPVGNSELDKNGAVLFKVYAFTFCPCPRKADGRTVVSCLDQWNASQRKAGEPSWRERGHGVWDLFRVSRGDDW